MMNKIKKIIFSYFDKTAQIKKTSSFDYNRTWNIIQSNLEMIESSNEKFSFLEYSLSVIKMQLRADYLSSIYRYGQFFLPEAIKNNSSLPHVYYLEDGTSKLWKPTEEKKKIYFCEDDVLVMPWSLERLIRAVKNICLCGFKKEAENNRAFYYTHLDLCIRDNGNHHAAAAFVFKQGEIEADIYNAEEIFPYIDVDEDGNFYHLHQDEKIDMSRTDEKLTLIYKLARCKWEIQKKSNTKKPYSRRRRILNYIEYLQEEVNQKMQIMDYDESKIIDNYFKLLEEYEELIHEKEMLELELQELKIKMELNKRA